MLAMRGLASAISCARNTPRGVSKLRLLDVAGLEPPRALSRRSISSREVSDLSG
jgi:hypothetical protein